MPSWRPRNLSWILALVLVVAVALSGARVVMGQNPKPIRIGFGMALTGGLAGNGKAALLAMQIWRDDVNKKGGLLGRPVELVFYDDQTNPATVPGIYTKLLDVDKVDFVVSGYGTNLIAPAMPLVIERKLTFMGLFGLANNEKHKYSRYFQISPGGPHPAGSFSEGFFELAAKQSPRPKTVALVGADAEFPQNALVGAREHAKRLGFKIIYDKTYPPNTVDYTPIVRAIKATNPELVFVASYPPDSTGMLLASLEVGLEPKLFGGGMVGLHFTTLLTRLGPKLNGLVDYGFWVPEPTMKYAGIEAFLQKYQPEAVKAGVDPLGFYLPPWAYAMMQVLGQAIEGTKGLDQGKVADYIHGHEFDTVVGKVKFGPDGEWAKSRTITIQFQSIKGNDADQFKQAGKQVVIYPEELRSGKLIYPYSAARK
ncbi:MAG: amino acid ABC transporter substrate-binding protein [Candidatus Rokuibacteriota bacterium]